MAEGFARAIHGERINSLSAGVNPHGLNPMAVKAMAESGIDISVHTSDHIDQYLDSGLDLVITVCGHANETCPVFPGTTRVEHVGFDDPPKLAEGAASEEEAMAHYRRVRDEIKAWVHTGLPRLLDELAPAGA